MLYRGLPAVAALLLVVGVSNQDWVRAPAPTFARHVAPILYAKCMPCHMEGQAGPMPLVTYEQAKKRASLMRRVAILHGMPPSRAESDFGPIPLHRALTDEEVNVIQAWADAGAPSGDLTQAPPPPSLPPKWRLGPPDLVVHAPEGLRVSADGIPYFHAWLVPVPVSRRERLVAMDIVPKTPQAFRSALVALDRSGLGQGLDAADPTIGYRTFGAIGLPAHDYVGGWNPGFRALKLPPGAGITIGPKDVLVVQALYQPSGKEEDGGCEIGLYFGREQDGEPPTWLSMGTDDFIIQPDERPIFVSRRELDEDMDLVAVYPEARDYARQVRLTANIPGRGQKTLLFIFAWRQFWVGNYVYPEPVRLPKGTVLEGEIAYDNKRHGDTRDAPKPFLIRPGPGPKDERCWIHLQMVRADRGERLARHEREKNR